MKKIKINKSILEYFAMSMDFDNEGEEYRKITENEFKRELTKALSSGDSKVEIQWV